jgi:ribonuclease P protein subunit POP4
VLPLAQLWLEYALEIIPANRLDLLGPQEREAVLDRILRMDWHGAYIAVQQCPAPERVGTEGVVLQETEHTFRIVTRDSRLRVLPKASTVFSVYLNDSWSLVLCGDALLTRSAERSVRKPKRKPLLLL